MRVQSIYHYACDGGRSENEFDTKGLCFYSQEAIDDDTLILVNSPKVVFLQITQD